MTEGLLLYMNLRSKQIVRLFAGIGPFRCLFLIGIAAILFYAFTKVTSVWVLPVCYLLMLWLYHNNRKDKEFLSLQMHGIKRLFTAEYLLLGLPFITSGIIAANYISLPLIILIAVVMPWIHPVRFHSIILPMPLLYCGDLLYRRMFRKQVLPYAVLLFLSFMGVLHDNINLCKVCLILWGAIQGTAYMVTPPKHELSVYNSFGMYQLILVKSGLRNIFITMFPFIVLILVLIHDTEAILFCLVLFSSTLLYQLNMGMARFSFETQTVMGIYWLLFPLPLFLVSIITPVVLILYLALNIGLTLSVKKKYKHIWN
ncbi:hypothetical protein [Bacteroides caecigallinarum]|uniref:hypothetical protein n=1 Tax=Bacteroides caecigallinarum TaxID=1411144 RepID=UPI001F2BFD56|nr:hypothetical protein [Bacteroides caecigallinarum]MCF2580812.1 hypothetical protein [Bacteroides caecigallinarum]